MAEAAAAATVAAAPREDEGEWDGAAEEEVMVLVDLPEFQGVDLFAGARRVEIRVRVYTTHDVDGALLGLGYFFCQRDAST